MVGVTAERPVRSIMMEMRSCEAVIRTGLQSGRYDERIRENIQNMSNLFEELKGWSGTVFGGEDRRWRELCGLSQSSLRKMDHGWQAGDLHGAQQEMDEINRLRREAHAEFRRGFWSAIKNIFKKNK